MSQRQILAILGVWVIVFLFLGFPVGWDTWISVITGLLIILVAYRKKPQQKSPSASQTPSNSAFVESNTSNTQ